MICHEDFVTYDARLASFTNPKKRAVTANGRAGKIMRWPHGSIRPEDMAAAGMFFDPATTNPDHTICFHCGKGLDGWENGDNPFDEHLTHSRSCSWAILKAVEFGVDSYDQLDPMDPGLVEARRETFAGLWPHEDKKGWKCKTKQLVESGWVYTPTLESNDMATCLYCSLALDGWEPGDKPINEHESRSASCPVILALKRNKKSRAKNSTLGNTSLLSLQSNATYMSEQPSIDIVAEPEDSVLTTTSTTSKKPTRAKKSATTSKGRKAKAKKEEPPEPEPMDAEQDNQLESEPRLVLLPGPAPAPAPAPRKRATVNKRTSEAMEDSAMTEAEAPAPKKKTRGRAVSPAAASVTEDVRFLRVEPPAKKTGNKKSAPRQSTRSSQERESSNASFMSAISTTQTQSMLEDIPDDEEIDKQLEADLERFTDHEDLSADSDSERRSRSRVESYQAAQTAQTKEAKNHIRGLSSNYAMFDPSPAVFEQDVEAEMKAMEVEMRASRAKKIEVKPRYELEPEYEAEPEPEPEPEPELQSVPAKKGRKAAASRKVSKTKSAKDTLEPTSEAEPSSAVVSMEEQVLPERSATTLNAHQDEDELAGSTNGTSATVIKKTTTVSASSKTNKAKQVNKQMPIHDTADEGQDEPENRSAQITAASKDSVVTPAAITEEAVDDTPPPPPPHRSLKIKSKAKQAKEPELEREAEHEPGHEPEISSGSQSQERSELEVEEPEELSLPIQGKATPPSRPATASSIPRPLPQSPQRTQAQTQQANTQTQTKAQTQPHLASSPIALRSSPRLRHAIALSPSQSPQASDAENKPPLSISGVLNLPLKKVVLAPPAENVGASAMALDTSASEATPHHGHYENHVALVPMGSPGKRTVMTNIRTVSAPWASIDVDQLFDDFAAGAHDTHTTGKDAEQKEREGGGDTALAETAIASPAAWIDLLQADQLSASEKDMTVEQWIHHNAAMAEKKMRQECEAMVSRFESEGSKAMRVLEGLVTE